jgi:hypothetical protein
VAGAAEELQPGVQLSAVCLGVSSVRMKGLARSGSGLGKGPGDVVFHGPGTDPQEGSDFWGALAACQEGNFPLARSQTLGMPSHVEGQLYPFCAGKRFSKVEMI